MANTSGRQSSIGNGQTMNFDAALYYNALVREVAQATGVTVVATEGTRTYARQLQLYNLYRDGLGNPAWSPDSPYAYHLSGRAVDVGSQVGYVNTAISKAFYARAGRYGFQASVKGEPWHFEWRDSWVSPDVRAAVSAASNGGATPITPLPVPPPREPDMYILQAKSDDNKADVYSILISENYGDLLTGEAFQFFSSITGMPVKGGGQRAWDLAMATKKLRSPYGVPAPANRKLQA